jgi:hypothetical protein
MSSTSAESGGNEGYYRFDDYVIAYGEEDEFDSKIPPRVGVTLRRFRVMKHTPKGVWLDLTWGKRRFVLNDSRKRFAHPSKEEARDSFLARKGRQVRILEARLEIAREALKHAEVLDIGKWPS